MLKKNILQDINSKEEIISHAVKAMNNSYSPYSKFPVGAVLILKNGTIYYGTNVENSSFGGTICAERSAIVSALSNGENKEDFFKMAVISKMKGITPPCSICRQTLVEFFKKESEIIMCGYNEKGEIIEKTTNVEELVPYSFTSKDLYNV